MNKEKYRELLEDFTVYARRFLKIKNKAGQIVPFMLNSAQEMVHRAYLKAVDERKRLWFIVLKARQEGVSTFWEGLIFRDCTTGTNLKAQIIGHEMSASNNLFEMTNRYYRELPDPMKPKLEHSNEKKLSFAELKSEILIASADVGGSLKRSDTLQRVHATEVAFWRDAKASMVALLQTASDPSTVVVVESTANGIGGWFYDTWVDAINGVNEFIPVFLPWFALPEYSKPFGSDVERDLLVNTLTPEEIDLRQTHSLTLEQLNWRRWAINNLCDKDADQFRQEYPSTWQEAFLVTGRPVFDQDLCRQNMNACPEKPVERGDLIYTDETRKAVEWVPNGRGFISVWEKVERDPLDRYRFIAGCDVAEGLEQGDYNSVPILDRKTMRVCLTWHGHLHPDLLAEEQHKMSLWLGQDLWYCTERNNHGLTTIVVAHKLGVQEYYAEDFQSGLVETTDKLGFKTSPASKPILLNAYVAAVRDKLFRCDDAEFWGEHLTFVKNSKGSMQAQGKDNDPATKCFDDRVMAGAMMWKGHSWLPGYYMAKRKEVDRPRSTIEDMLKADYVEQIFKKLQTPKINSDSL